MYTAELSDLRIDAIRGDVGQGVGKGETLRAVKYRVTERRMDDGCKAGSGFFFNVLIYAHARESQI